VNTHDRHDRLTAEAIKDGWDELKMTDGTVLHGGATSHPSVITHRRPRIVVVGHGRSGKDESLVIIERLTNLRSAGTLSKYLTPFVALEQGVTEEQAYATRHENRALWMRVGNAMRANDPSILARMAFQHGDVTGGVRGRPEIEAIRAERLADLIVWIDRDVPVDPTMEYGPEYADVRIDNNGSLADLEAKWRNLLAFGGLL